MKDLIARHALFVLPVFAALLAAMFIAYAGAPAGAQSPTAHAATMSIPF
jgi:hypothetical protein